MEETCIKQRDIRERLENLPGKAIIILDAAFPEKKMASGAWRPKQQKVFSAIASGPFKAKENLFYITATSSDNYANDYPEKRRGLFSYYFLRALEEEREVDKNKNLLMRQLAWMTVLTM